LDWAVNNPAEHGQPVMVRYADDFVTLCESGQGEQLLARLSRWLFRVIWAASNLPFPRALYLMFNARIVCAR
jgi:hypothetical protein